MRSERIVRRAALKTKLQHLELVFRTHQPLIKAMGLTKDAYQAGIKEGLRQASLQNDKPEQAPSVDPNAVDVPASMTAAGISHE